MNNRLTELAVGLFILLGIGGTFILTSQVSNLDSYSRDGNHRYVALFEDIGGLKPGSAVKLSGFTVGRVDSIGFDTKARRAKVSMMIQSDYKDIPTDSQASIYTSGLLGENFVGLELGTAEQLLAENGVISRTESAVVLEKALASLQDSVGSFFGASSVPEGFTDQSYTVFGLFEEIGSLKVGAPVKMAGVAIGYVTAIDYDKQTFQAKVSASINKQYSYIPADSGASILSSSLIGGSYLGIEPGGAEETLQDGSRLEYAQSALILEKVISRVLFSMASDKKDE